jgi:Cys-rich protein (TIGR01571 family)
MEIIGSFGIHDIIDRINGALIQLKFSRSIERCRFKQLSQGRSGLCDCCSTPACCLSCCCPCCVVGQKAAAMIPEEVCAGGNYCGSCCLHYILIMPTQFIDVIFAPFSIASIVLPLGTLYRCPMRSAIKKKHHIPGSDCEDCLIVWWCACCALAQVVYCFEYRKRLFLFLLFHACNLLYRYT